MTSFEHKKISEYLIELDTLPNNDQDLSEWVKAKAHLDFLEMNENSKEIVVYASPEYSYIYSMVVPEESLAPLDKADLLRWSTNPFTSSASYVYGGGKDDVWVEYGPNAVGSEILAEGSHLVYGRIFEGWAGEDKQYFEISQEYAHLEGIHWRPEASSYCKFDQNGDLKPIVSITKENSGKNISLITFSRQSLDQYLACSGQVLIRLFDFTLLDRSNFSKWGDDSEILYDDSDTIFYRQKIYGKAAYTRGVQIVKPSSAKEFIFSKIKKGWFGDEEKDGVEFIANDFRNNIITNISTSSDATTNYFEANENDLPYELSPAFFKPEVLLKYKADKDKYKIEERRIYCRAAWFLKSYDVNEAGQIFTYICDLRNLPESELLHWKSYNEEPKASISERALENDFKGQWVSHIDPLEKIKNISRCWGKAQLSWWVLKDDRLIDKVSVPLTSSMDEWGDAFLSLTQLIVEGFIVKGIRKELNEKGIDFNTQEKSLVLLEKIINFNKSLESAIRLDGLRSAQHIRNKVKGHSAIGEADGLSLAVLSEHETYAAHFRHVCELIINELEIIQSQLLK